MAAFRIVGSPPQQGLHQRIATGRQIVCAEIQAFLAQPIQDGDTGGGGVQSHTVGEATISDGVVGQNEADPPLRCWGRLKLHPAPGMLHDPIETLTIGHQRWDGRRQAIGVGLEIAKCTGARGDSSIQFRHHNLQGQIQRIQSPAAALPGGLGS